MKIDQLKETLLNKGFDEEKLDTGFNFTKTVKNVQLICYIEPNINVSFITVYSWDNNDVKGTYDLTMKELGRVEPSAISFFRKTLDNMPKFVGEKNIHTEVEEVISETFQ